jgi:hypothetical protein
VRLWQPLHRSSEHVAASGDGLHDVLLSITHGGSKLENELNEGIVGDDRRSPDRRHQFFLPENPLGICRR